MRYRPARAVLGALFVVAALAAPGRASADLRIHVDGGGVAPVDRVLTNIGPGFLVGGSIDYEVVNLLAVGVFYSFTDLINRTPHLPCDCPELTEDPQMNIFDHTVGARLDLRFVRHRTAGWFGNDRGNTYGEAFLELDLAYHLIGQISRIGWGFGLGYRVIAAGPFGFGPYFRFTHIVSDITDVDGNVIHQMYFTIGLTLFLSFDLTGDEDQGGSGGEDEWSGFEAVDDEGAGEEEL